MTKQDIIRSIEEREKLAMKAITKEVQDNFKDVEVDSKTDYSKFIIQVTHCQANSKNNMASALSKVMGTGIKELKVGDIVELFDDGFWRLAKGKGSKMNER